MSTPYLTHISNPLVIFSWVRDGKLHVDALYEEEYIRLECMEAFDQPDEFNNFEFVQTFATYFDLYEEFIQEREMIKEDPNLQCHEKEQCYEAADSNYANAIYWAGRSNEKISEAFRAIF